MGFPAAWHRPDPVSFVTICRLRRSALYERGRAIAVELLYMLYITCITIKLLTSKSSLGTQTEYPRVIPRFFKNQEVGDLEVKKSQILRCLVADRGEGGFSPSSPRQTPSGSIP